LLLLVHGLLREAASATIESTTSLEATTSAATAHLFYWSVAALV
jgi:hypothetical protein